MFSPASARSRGKGRDVAAVKGRTPLRQADARFLPVGEEALPSSPSTPLQTELPEASRLFPSPGSTVTPSPFQRRVSSTPIRSPPLLRGFDKSGGDTSQPVFVSDLPKQLRVALSEEEPDGRPETSQICGGMDEGTGLSWMICGTCVFVWRHVSHQWSENFRKFAMPNELCTPSLDKIDSKHGDSWVVCITELQSETQTSTAKFTQKCISASMIICSRKSLAVVHWADIFSDTDYKPVLSLGPGGSLEYKGLTERRASLGWTGAAVSSHVRSMVSSFYMNCDVQGCVAIVCLSTGELWRLDCHGSNIYWKKIYRDVDDGPAQGDLGKSFPISNSVGARSLVWRPKEGSSMEGWRQLLLLTAAGIECWDVELSVDHNIQLLWKYDVFADLDSGKVLTGQKQTWLLDFQWDITCKRLKLLLASYCKDKVNGSNYMQYFTASYSCLPNSLRREGGIQIVLPKARIEEEEFLLSMQLRVGGKPEGSVMILASDGTATVAYCQGGAMKLYKFNLGWDAGKVIDACVLPSSEEKEGGSWLVLTERAGVWAIPGDAVLLCGVEPPERSLSRKGSLNDRSIKEDKRHTGPSTWREDLKLDETIEMKGNLAALEHTSVDVEVEALVGQFFTNFLTTGRADGVAEKLQLAGAFEKEDNTNVFVLASKAIVDALPKHWTSSMSSNTAILAAVSAQLADKQCRHQQFLQFLSASNCHEELRHRQRSTLHLIMEHGEKLSAVISLRELHNLSAQARQQGLLDSEWSSKTEVTEASGAMWELVLLTGEKARRNNVMLLDRDKAEIFYSRITELEDLFSCIHLHFDVIVIKEQPTQAQAEKACEIAHACAKALKTGIRFRDTHHTWYPSPEGLTPWYCKPVVRMGLWKLATVILDLKEEVSVLLPSLVMTLMSHLEEVADVLLEAYAGAITAMVEREEEYRALQMEYWSRRDLLLSAMHQHVRRLFEDANKDADGEIGERNRLNILQELYSPLVSLARRHAGYQTLWDICSELKDMSSLRSFMHESMGLREGRFSNFVFEQCYKNKQFSKLLRLGQEFKEDLSLFLQKHKDLLWLHDLHIEHFSLASSTLHWLAFSKEPVVSAAVEYLHGNWTPYCKTSKLKMAHRKRLLNMAKLSALAGGDSVLSEKVMDIDADIEMLKVQMEAYQCNLVEEDDVLTPRQLVEICLKSDNRNLFLRLFHVFAWGGDIFRKSNRSLLEAAWLKAVDFDDWIMMRQVSERDGWSDEQHVEALHNTVLYEAARCCYSCFQKGGSFENVLPLLCEETEEGVEFKSVETILMRHADFPEAGQIMIAAIQMGSSTEDAKSLGDEMDIERIKF
ncbi:hypothetical protein KP509_39G025700 [Ceratopteris richardii]|uniref:Nucleoporin Nup133/Nup155-like N-terminal domain-containing protein n=1 Tax=Ceratopteris richardii TaxID=49495 RepID=A0A8T2PZG6_CERRI|nr:hypothetical protein KP509_39G025700 [Ceratopteris richardii]